MKLVQNNSRSRNQRVSSVRRRRQQHLLDVKVRSRRVTQHRIRKGFVFFSKIALLAMVCGGGYVLARETARRSFFENSEYQLRTIDLQTDGTLQREQILNAADLREGQNIFKVNLARVHDQVQQLPQVDDAQIIRKLPDEIDIRVVERKPVAWLTNEQEIADPFVSDAAFLVDARGVLMKQKRLLPEYLGLPLISGCSSELLESGKIIESSEAKTALELLRLTASSSVQSRFQIREIDISKSYRLLVTDKNHSRVTFGLNDLEEQLRRLEQFLVYCDNTKQELDTANLLVLRNIPVTFTKPAAAVINDTIVPAIEPQPLKAVPVHPQAKQTVPPSDAHRSSTALTSQRKKKE